MQIIHTWPEDIILALPEQVKTALIQHLIQPFKNNKAEAKSYWQEENPILVILDSNDTRDSLKQLDDLLHHKIERALDNPEYSEDLAHDYVIKLAIFSNAGEGIYCVIPKELDLALIANRSNHD